MQKGLSEMLNMLSPDISNLEDFLVLLRDLPNNVIVKEQGHLEAIHSIHVVGFHHKQGSIVEFSYPTTVKSDLLPYLSLPDCVHNETSETFYFTLEIDGQAKHCVSCFRQIPNPQVTEEMNRNFVQKALVVISNLPFFGQIASIMQPTTQVYFEQKDFINTAIIAEVFESLQTSLVSCTVSDLTIGFSPRMLVHMFKEKVMVLWKIILLRGRILVFSKKPSVISSVILALVSLFPGELCFGKFQFCEKYEKHLRSFGLPLGLFGENCAFHPYFSLFQLGELEKQGYLVGCTNQMIMEHPKAAPNALINLETMKIKFNLPGKLAKCVKLNSHETKFIKEICKSVEGTWDGLDTWNTSENINWHGSHHYVQAEFHNFLKTQLSNLALLRLKLQGLKVETTFKISKETQVKQFKYNKMDPKLSKVWRSKKFMKGLKSSFLFRWSNLPSFRSWLQGHTDSIAYLSEFCGLVANSEIYEENGSFYHGSLCKGKKHGIGVYKTPDYKYEGDWKEGFKNGKGIIVSTLSDHVYDGEWCEDQQSGFGNEIKGKEKYTGSFFQNKFHGNGIFIDSFLNQYDGEWLLGKKNGMGHWVNTVGDQYKGEFSNDLFEGHGQFTFSNGDIYVGDFRKGEISGFGEYLYLNGEVYKGHFEKGVPEGKGELQKNSGVKVEGNFVAGEVLRDECTVRYDDGRVFRGSVDEKFKANGRGVMEFPSSNIIPGLWTHGIQDS